MDELLKQFLANAPYAAISLYMLRVVYQDWKADRQKTADQRDQQTALLATMSERLDSIDKAISGTNKIQD